LNNQGLEHQNHIQRLAPGRTFPLRLAQSLSQNGAKHLEINPIAQLFQRVVQTTQSDKALAFIEKRHSNNCAICMMKSGLLFFKLPITQWMPSNMNYSLTKIFILEQSTDSIMTHMN
jgi:hypothetical protein